MKENRIKKIGIITICDYTNYGNRLQNYASQEVLKSFGYEIETIVNTQFKKNNNEYIVSQGRLSRIKSMSVKEFFEIVKVKVKYKMNYKNDTKCYVERIDAFKKFTDANINESKFTISENNIPMNISEEYDYVVVGSDQVWNPIFRNCSPIDFLTFVPKYKRIAYAPSFGISSIPDEFAKNYKEWLSEMKYLSVREEAGAKIIKEFTGRDAVVLVDPTLMLSKEKWLSVSKSVVKKPKSKYLLTYFLGEISKANNKRIRQIASDNKLEIVNLTSIKDSDRYAADPGEFIDYINSASVILTDSFHGTVFSILLEKPFIIFDRIEKIPSMNSRIDTLLSIFNLQSRKLGNILGKDDVFNVNYSHVASILEFERNKALHYLKSSLQEKDEI